MLTGLLQQKNSNFEGITRREFAAIGYRFIGLSVPPQSGSWPVEQIDGEPYFARDFEDT